MLGSAARVELGSGLVLVGCRDYGMGNFVFDVDDGGVTAGTGVLTLTVDHGRTLRARWSPAQLLGDVARPLTGAAARLATRQRAALRSCTRLMAGPTA